MKIIENPLSLLPDNGLNCQPEKSAYELWCVQVNLNYFCVQWWTTEEKEDPCAAGLRPEKDVAQGGKAAKTDGQQGLKLKVG